MVGRDGSVPIMVCLVPLINKDPLHHFTHSMKVSSIHVTITELINKNICLGFLLKLHSYSSKTRSEPELQLSFELNTTTRPRIYYIRKHNVKL